MKKVLSILSLFFVVLTTTGAGYMGTLPNIEAEFSYLREEASAKTQAPFSVKELDKQNEKELKPIPRDDDDYVDIIIKRDKTSKYMNDVNGVVIIMEKLRRCLNTDQDIQKFNAIVSNFIDHVEYIRVEYADKPEASFMSYRRLIDLSNQARETATFRMKGLASQKYLPYTSDGNIYTRENLDYKLSNLLNNVNDTLYVIKNLE